MTTLLKRGKKCVSAGYCHLQYYDQRASSEHIACYICLIRAYSDHLHGDLPQDLGTGVSIMDYLLERDHLSNSADELFTGYPFEVFSR